MTDITEYVINAVVARLKSEVTEVSNRVYFAPPQKTIFPYVQFGFTIDALPIKGLDALNYTITINTYAQRGTDGALAEATRIGRSIFGALNNYALSLSSGLVYSCTYDNFSTAFVVEDGRTVNHVSRFKILTTSEEA